MLTSQHHANEEHSRHREKSVDPIAITVAEVTPRVVQRTVAVVGSLYGQEEIVMNAVANIGIAVALEAAPDDPTRSGGLIVPVVRGVGDKGLEALAADIADVSKRARGNKLRPDDVSDGTFTISNLGMFGVDRFTAIINPPNVAILAVGAAIQRPVVRDGQVVPGWVMTMTMSSDHRIVDGAMAAQYLATVKGYLEKPAGLLV